MAGIWEQLLNLFKKAEESSPSQPLIHELIERSPAEKEDYSQWKKTLVRRRLQDWLNDQYAVFRVTPQHVDEGLDFLDTPSAKGFVIYFYKTRYSERDIRHFFDFLREQVLDIGYRTQISDTRTYNRPGWVETVERHYLKPHPASLRDSISSAASYSPPKGYSTEKIDQRFGNVTIEFHLRDDRPHYLKFLANSYRDHLFEEAEDFKVLMGMILQPLPDPPPRGGRLD